MTDKPIIFRADMIRALLDGRKTQTRRILKPEYAGALPYVIKDRLWVRETCATWIDETITVSFPVSYATEDDWEAIKQEAKRDRPEWKIRSPIHMPRWASRLTLIVTDFRVQRVQDIGADDCRAEGYPIKPEISTDPKVHDEAARNWFMDLWSSIYGPDAWYRNDWVAAYTFEVHRKNIDQMET